MEFVWETRIQPKIEIVLKENTMENIMELYSIIYDYSTSTEYSYENFFYSKYTQIIETNLLDQVTMIDKITIIQYNNLWKTFLYLNTVLKKSFMYLERHFIPKNNLKSLEQIGFDAFEHIVHKKYYYYCSNELLNHIDYLREKNIANINYEYFKFIQVINILKQFDFISCEIIHSSKIYYSTLQLQYNSLDEFMTKIETIVKFEEELLIAYDFKNSVDANKKVIMNELLSHNIYLTYDNILNLLRSHHFITFYRCYLLYKNSSLYDTFLEIFKQVVKVLIKQYFFKNINELHVFYIELNKYEHNFKNIVYEILNDIINTVEGNKELVHYILNINTIDSFTLDLLLGIHHKDQFLLNYLNALQSAYINENKINLEKEILFLNELKKRHGYAYISRFSSIINDIQSDTKNILINNVELNIKVLTNFYWNVEQNISSSIFDCDDANSLKQLTSTFENEYKQEYSNRKLTWSLENGTVELSNGESTIVIKPIGALILLNIQNNSRYIKEIPYANEYINKFLELGIIDGNETNYFINSNLSNQYIIKNINKKQNYENDQNVRCSDWTIDACIVKLMKKNKSLHHKNLVLAVCNDLGTMKPKLNKIKERINVLIEKEYIERDISDMQIYYYLP
jgi:hypothetical protein